VRVDQAEQSGKFNAALEQAKLDLSLKIEVRHEQEFRLELEKHQNETSEMLLNQALRAKADEINASGLSQAAKIAAMRQAAFADVAALEASGKLKLPKP
jgi:DNA uptake protein ComE-like DNA-binding protein